MVSPGSRPAKGKTEKPPRGLNKYLRDECGYTQEQRAQELGRSERTIQRWDREDRERPTGEQPGTYPNFIQAKAHLEKIESHLNGLTRVLVDLTDLQVFPPDASQIRAWSAWPTQTSWPVSQGQIYRDDGGNFLVKLDVQGQEIWGQVRQHLDGHPVLDAIEGWKQAAGNDMAARRRLLEALLRYVAAHTRLPVWVSVNEGEIKKDGLHNHYIDLVYDQVFRTAVNAGPALFAQIGGPPRLERTQFFPDAEGNLCRYNDLLIRGCDEVQRKKAICLLLNAHTLLSGMPQATTAGQAYHEADALTSQVRGMRVDFLKSGLEPDPNQSCEECRNWFRALGIESTGPGC